MAILSVMVCLDELDQSKFFKNKNGKTCFDLSIVETGGELLVQEKRTKEEKENDIPYKKVGYGKVLTK